MDQTVEHVIRSCDDLHDALRARKEMLGLSNIEIEAQLSLADGIADKYLGPSQTKSLCTRILPDLMRLMGVELVMRVNPSLASSLRDRIERRAEAQVRPHRRLSKELLSIARARIFKELSARGNEARKAKLPREARSNIARLAAIARWQRHRAAVKAAAVSEVRA